MLLETPGTPLVAAELPPPQPAPGQVRIAVAACGVCRTDVHIRDGELTEPKLPLVLGHQIVGRVVEGDGFAPGTRVGVPWLGWADGTCGYCTSGRENLCDGARFTGYTVDGGFAEQAVADARFCIALPEEPEDVALAPLLCAGLIGYRALRFAGDPGSPTATLSSGRASAALPPALPAPERLGLYGFGASAHLVAQIAAGRIFAFTRPGDDAAQSLARELGAEWAGGSDELPPEELDAAIVFAPVGALVPAALRAVAKGGVVVCAGIHMSDIPSFPYELLWGERSVVSVANLTRDDGRELFRLDELPRAHVEVFDLSDAEQALDAIRAGRLHGAAVLRVGGR
jgi:propanol-preferring alcohol dehydrogenase